MTDIELVEHAPHTTHDLPAALGRALAASRFVDAAPDPYRPGGWRLRAGSKVGAVVVRAPGEEPVTLRITPKVPVGHVFFLLGYALDPGIHREDAVEVATHTELVPFLAQTYARAQERALRQGVLQGYRPTEEASPVVRGRLRETDQVRRYHGRLFPLEVAYDEYTTDTPENRLLRAATERLLSLPRVPIGVRRVLQHQRARLADAEPLVRGAMLPRWRPSRLNLRYQPALRLAETVLRGGSPEHLPGDVSVDGFLLDMNKLFEDFVCVALREALSAYGGHCALQARGVHLDAGRRIRMRPDLLRYADDGRPLTVADAKYKAQKSDGFPDADLYQMLAYCTALDLPEGHLIYARGGALHASHRVRNAGIVIHQHVLDLEGQPAQLLGAVQELARLMAEGTGTHPL
ncbi:MULTISPECIES: McrC family protein [Streptomyces]|uniref:McrC family protein n=1 Tax=Streptomyces TaxID=1883 RepID=UPI0016739B95|nr:MULTISPECIES: restriction endonuclease [Streptomyces]MBK3525369.1 restriction endonuclease [Streptomyces sp. MBT70]GGR84973.1 McrBC 5-methylcytosine restriction system component [Streptomyces eurythermus]